MLLPRPPLQRERSLGLTRVRPIAPARVSACMEAATTGERKRCSHMDVSGKLTATGREDDEVAATPRPTPPEEGESKQDLVVDNADRCDIQASLAGDEEAYSRLIKRYEQEIARQMRRFSRDGAVCEELTQEVFVEAYFSLDRYRGDAPFLHWLRRIASRVGYRFWKRQARDGARVPLEEWDERQAPGDSLDPADAGAILHALFARLGPEDRLVLTLLYLEDCGTAEIAKRMGWNRAMVKMRAYRARNKLKQIAEQEHLLEKLGWTP